MKKLFIIILLLSTLVACSDKYTVERISDGATLRATDELDRDFVAGDTICIGEAGLYADIPYEVSTDMWKDTTICGYSMCWTYSMAVVK